MAFLNTKDEQLIDFAADVADAANLLLVIDQSTSPNKTLRVINRIQTIDSVETIRTPDLLDLQVNPAFPIKMVFAEYTFNQPFEESRVLVTSTRRVEHKSGLDFGEEKEYVPLHQEDDEVKKHLRNILESESSFQATARIFSVKSDLNIGDRVQCIDDKKMLKAIITIFSILYDFDNEETTISGATSLEFVRAEAT